MPTTQQMLDESNRFDREHPRSALAIHIGCCSICRDKSRPNCLRGDMLIRYCAENQAINCGKLTTEQKVNQSGPRRQGR